LRPPVRIIVCLGLIAGLLLSPKLWLTARSYPLTPVCDFLPPLPPPFDAAVFAAMIALLMMISAVPGAKWLTAAFLALAFALAITDQSRWQPWFYQYVFMLIAIAFGRADSALQICRLIVVSIYFWSGIQKINPAFQRESFDWLLAPLPFSSHLEWLWFAVPVMESAIAIGLLTRRFRNLSVTAAVAMHALILASIGPCGHNHNRVVWPWNIAMALLVILLFWRKEFAPRDLLPGTRLQAGVLVLFSIMPAFSFLDLWDSYLSFALYSGNQRKATIYMADTVAGRLPDAVQEVVDEYESEFKVDTLDIEEWSYSELNAPDYAETRVVRNIARRVCREVDYSPLLVLVVEGRRLWFRRPAMSLYTCRMLAK
jgi:hypothetical protein